MTITFDHEKQMYFAELNGSTAYSKSRMHLIELLLTAYGNHQKASKGN